MFIYSISVMTERVEYFWIAIFASLTFVALASSLQVLLEYKPDRHGWHWKMEKTLRDDISGWRIQIKPPRHKACDVDLPDDSLTYDQISIWDANRINIAVDYFITSCSSTQNNGGSYCDEAFRLYVNQSGHGKAYQKVAEIRQSTDTKNSETINVLVNGKGIILASHNDGACSTVISVKVTYNVCPHETLSNSLVSLPRTVAPAIDSNPIQVEGNCNKNTVHEQGSLYVLCQSSGKWNTAGLEGRCICKEDMQNNGGICRATTTTVPTTEATTTTVPTTEATTTTVPTTEATTTTVPTTEATTTTVPTTEATTTTVPTTEATTTTVPTTEATTTTVPTTEDSKTAMYKNIIYGLVGFVGLLIVLIVPFACCKISKRWRRRKKAKLNKRPIAGQSGIRVDDDIPMLSMATYQNVDDICASFNLDRDQITLVRLLGTGNFGQVSKAIYGASQSEVAVKSLKDNASRKDLQDMLSELDVMKSLQPHPHVVRLIGCCIERDPLLIVLEYLPYGDLLGYLRKSRGLEDTYNTGEKRPNSRLTEKDLLSFAWMIADGMSYLAKMKVVHRDLAARNVLLCENRVCKISDFGLARGLEEDVYTRRTQARLPVKWMPPESLFFGKSTIMSDVWSYGIVMWEVFTIGESPYPGVTSGEVAGLLQTGYRMPRPRHISAELYSIMTECWEEQPQKRPTFQWLCSAVRRLLDDHKTYVNLEVYDDKDYVNFDMVT